jgi:Flp pilus assembly protein TadD
MLSRLLILLSVLALVPATAVADLASAQKLFEEGRADAALTEVDSLLASNPADPELRFLKGIIFAEQGKNDEAIEIFAALTRDYPELPEPYNNLAVLFAEKGEFEKAREARCSRRYRRTRATRPRTRISATCTRRWRAWPTIARSRKTSRTNRRASSWRR